MLSDYSLDQPGGVSMENKVFCEELENDKCMVTGDKCPYKNVKGYVCKYCNNENHEG